MSHAATTHCQSNSGRVNWAKGRHHHIYELVYNSDDPSCEFPLFSEHHFFHQGIIVVVLCHGPFPIGTHQHSSHLRSPSTRRTSESPHPLKGQRRRRSPPFC